MQPTRRWFVRGLALLPLGAAVASAEKRLVFTVPDEATRLAAAGALDHLPAKLRAAFSPGPGDLPVPAPDPSDWLAQHPDEGQTYAQFLRMRQHKPTESRRTIAVKPLGQLAASAPLATIMDFAARYFMLPVTRRLTTPIAALKATQREHGGRTQYLTESLIDALIPMLPPDAFCMIAVTMEDLYPHEDWNYVFGQARFHDGVGVYSFVRYDPKFHGEPHGPGTDKLILRRCLKLMVHEIGHMFAIRHCIYYECAMNGSNHLEETDRSPLHLCPVCLRKLHDSIGFDVEARERKLAEFFRAHDLTPEAEHAERRLARLVAAI